MEVDMEEVVVADTGVEQLSLHSREKGRQFVSSVRDVEMVTNKQARQVNDRVVRSTW